MIKSVDFRYLKNFYTYVLPYKSIALLALVMMPISIGCNLLFPWLMINVIDQHLAIAKFDGLMPLIGFMLVVLVVNYFSDAFYAYFLRKTGQKAIFDMRMTLLKRVFSFPRSYFDKTPTGVTLSRLTTDLESIGESFITSILSLIKDSITTVAIISFMFYIHWQLTLIILLVFPPVLWLTNYIRHQLRQQYLQTRVSLAKGIGFLQECLQGIKTVQLYNAETEVEKRYNRYLTEFMRAQLKTNTYDASLFSIITGITSITIGLLIWYGSNKVLEGVVTLGILITFINMLEKVFVPLREFTSQITAIQSSFAAFEHIDELFTEAREEDGRQLLSASDIGTSLDTFQHLVFKNVSFRYTESSPYVLNNINFTLHKGEQLALVGTTGSGKSTIIRLINKIYLDYEGSILLNGIELSSIPKKAMTRLFSLMQQDVFLFEKDIHFNISLGNKDVTDQMVRDAAKYVYADEMIKAMPNQYNFVLKNNGGNISAGQAQLISFARAIAQGGQVMVLDEATSSVDSMTEELIQKAIKHLFQEKTVIAIAHRLSTIRSADQILVMDQGHIIEQGNHQSLLSLNGTYAQLLNTEIKE